MHLINTTTLELHDFVPGWSTPAYAILTHCWGSEEVGYKDFVKKRRTASAGYQKISACCKLALSRGLDWVWIDTCCIDKRSSSELSEAINSMYQYYAEAEECYAFLEDVHHYGRDGPEFILKWFRHSRWFTRGWTLQELVAPRLVLFLDDHWKVFGYKLGSGPGSPPDPYNDPLLPVLDEDQIFKPFSTFNTTRQTSCRDLRKSHVRSARSLEANTCSISPSQMIDELVDITNIPEAVLLNPEWSLRHYNFGTKISWLASRFTTRPEDLAYCLLGLLGLNMPLMYGEGNKAFLRLQTEIMRVSSDESIFSWHAAEQDGPRHNLLAAVPRYFADAFAGRQVQLFNRLPYFITNQGLQFTISPHSRAYIDSCTSSEAPDWILISMNCLVQDEEHTTRCWMYVKRLRCRHYIRRTLSPETIKRTLSVWQARQMAEPTNDSASVEDRRAVEIAASLVIIIHFAQTEICRLPGNGGSADFESCIEQKSMLIRRLLPAENAGRS